MSRCLSCKKICSGEMIVIIDKNRVIKEGYSGFYNVCNNCQALILKPLEVLNAQVKAIKDYEERKQEYNNTRNWCRKCWQDTGLERWTMLFIDVNGYLKNTSYVHGKCCTEILNQFHIVEKGDITQNVLFG